MYLGPNSSGKFRQIEVISIHCYKVPVRMATCGQSCSIGIREIKEDEKWLRLFNAKKGMMLVEAAQPPKSSVGFVAEFSLFDENSEQLELPPFYEPVLNAQTFKQTCMVVSLDGYLVVEEEELREIELTRLRSKSEKKRENR